MTQQDMMQGLGSLEVRTLPPPTPRSKVQSSNHCVVYCSKHLKTLALPENV